MEKHLLKVFKEGHLPSDALASLKGGDEIIICKCLGGNHFCDCNNGTLKCPCNLKTLQCPCNSGTLVE